MALNVGGAEREETEISERKFGKVSQTFMFFSVWLEMKRKTKTKNNNNKYNERENRRSLRGSKRKKLLKRS